jgi:V/A-type H+-transporting ATPase subunit E
MEVRKEYLTAKHALLDEVFVKANEQILRLGDAEYRKLIMGLMVKVAKSGDEEVVIGKNENRINDRLIKDVNRQLGPGYRGNLRMASDRADIGSGFILRRGKVQVNVSTDVLVAQAREALEMEIIGGLFG